MAVTSGVVEHATRNEYTSSSTQKHFTFQKLAGRMSIDQHTIIETDNGDKDNDGEIEKKVKNGRDGGKDGVLHEDFDGNSNIDTEVNRHSDGACNEKHDINNEDTEGECENGIHNERTSYITRERHT